MTKDNFLPLQLSEKVSDIPEALSIYINQIVYTQKRKGVDIITLSLGEAYFDIPLFDFKKLNFEKGYHYSDSSGLPELRKKISEYYSKFYNVYFSYEDEIIISSGSKPLIYMALQAILNPDDEVVIHEPAWLSYQEQVKLANGNPKFIPYYCDIKDFKNYLTEKTKILIINNPNNPAGRIYSREELNIIYQLCREREIYVIVDEAYSDFTEEKFCSILNVVPDKDGVIAVNSLSKNMGISGWRIGYVIADKKIIQNILKLNQHLLTCAPTVLQMYLAEYFDQIIEITIPQVKEVIKKRKRIMTYMNKKNIKYLIGGATFYFFIDISEFKGSSLDFCLYLLLKYNIAAVPGSAYGESTNSFIRIGIGTESEERIYKALNIIKKVIDKNEVEKDYIDQQLNENKIHMFSKF